MYIIIFETENHKQWVCDYEFATRKEAIQHLNELHFKEEKYIFYKKASRFKGAEKAYIQRLKKKA